MKFVRILIVALTLGIAGGAVAQPPQRRDGCRPDKTAWLEKLKRFKHEYLTRELGLTPEQQQEFFPLYDAKEDERFRAEREVRHRERELERKGDSATDAELDASADEQYGLDAKIAEIEKKYMVKFRKVLNKRQLFRLRRVERDFQRTLMENRKGGGMHHGRK